jgi:VIT1/CCC1 family predicted Fe2+/Mn2+ transporter
MANPDVALDTHARLELGVDPDDPGSSWQAAAVSFLSFSVGAVLPLLPWFFTSGTTAALASVIIGALAAVALGATIGSFSGQGCGARPVGNCSLPSSQHPSHTGWAASLGNGRSSPCAHSGAAPEC